MCLVINKSLINDLVYDDNGFTTVYKFMVLDPEGNLWSPKWGGRMELDAEGNYLSNRTSTEVTAAEVKLNQIDKGIHTFTSRTGAEAVIKQVESWDYLARLIKRWQRPEGSKLVVVEFKAHESDFISTGTLEQFVVDTLVKNYPESNLTNAVFTKVKFVHVV